MFFVFCCNKNIMLRPPSQLPQLLRPTNEEQSKKSLYKSDSVSSQQIIVQRKADIPKQFATMPTKQVLDEPALNQIRKFIQKADILNRNSFRRLKQDAQLPQFPYADRSSASLYRNVIDFQFTKTSRNSPNKIYISKDKKIQQKRRIYRVPQKRNKNVSHREVQTDKNQEELVKYLEMYQEPEFTKRVQTNRKSVPLQKVKQFDEQTLPRKRNINKNNFRLNQTISVFNKEKYQEKIHSALINVAKVQHNFANIIYKNQRYKESNNEPTVFLKNVGQIRPLSITFDKPILENQSSKEKNDSRVTKQTSTQKYQHMATITQEVYLNKMQQINQNTAQRMTQVPSFHELKIQPQEKQHKSKINHPISQQFSDTQLDWITNKYQFHTDIFKNINPNSFEIKKYKNGVYFGELNQSGQKQFKGILFYFNGRIYEGEFKNDIKEGRGYELYPDGSIYNGDFAKGLREGRGTFEWGNKQVYEGQWAGGKKHGSGMWKSENGDSYIGEWHWNKVEGFGVFTTKDGTRYEGEFVNSLKHGLGTERFPNGETYVGYYEKNRPNAEGEYFWKNGDYYKGDFSNGVRHGKGYFKEGKTQIQYKGQYRNDKKCGFGELRFGENQNFVGNFQNDLRHGYGELYKNNEKVAVGYWINNQLINDQIKTQQTKSIINNSQNKSSLKSEDKSNKNEIKSHQNSNKNEIKSHQNSNKNEINSENKDKIKSQYKTQAKSNPQQKSEFATKQFIRLQRKAVVKQKQKIIDYTRPCACNKNH